MSPSAVDHRSAPVAPSRTWSSTRPSWSISSATSPVAAVRDHLSARRAVDGRRPAGGAGGGVDAGDATVLGGHDGDRARRRGRPARPCGLGRTGRRRSTRQRGGAGRAVERLEPVDRTHEHGLGVDGDERLGVLHVDPPTGRAVGDADRRHGVRLDRRTRRHRRRAARWGRRRPSTPHRIGSGCTVGCGATGRTGAARPADRPTEITEQAARREHRRARTSGAHRGSRDAPRRGTRPRRPMRLLRLHAGPAGASGSGCRRSSRRSSLRPPCLGW